MTARTHQKLLLITGIPGTGKTTIGNYLEKYSGFQHLDIEKLLLDGLGSQIPKIIQDAIARNSDVALSWGFLPFENVSHVKSLVNLGFKLIWFDGNRTAALREFNKRGTVPDHLFHIQIQNIENSGVIAQLLPIQINSFDENGDFKSVDTLARELLKTFEES